MNAPCTTVAEERGQWRIGQDDAVSPTWVGLLDLPGTYSLLPANTGEADRTGHGPANARLEHPGDGAKGMPDAAFPVAANQSSGAIEPCDAPASLTSRPDLAVVMIDASAPAAGLYLLGQLALLGVPLVAAWTKTDLLQDQPTAVQTDHLAKVLGVPVVVVNPRRGQGSTQLAQQVSQTLALGPTTPRPSGLPPFAGEAPDHADRAQWELEQTSQTLFDWVARIIQRAGLDEPPSLTRSDRIDRWLLKGWVGVPVFLAVLWGMFQLASAVMQPLQAWLEEMFNGPLNQWLSGALARVGLGDTWVESLLLDGLLAAVGVVFSLLPLIAVVFLAVSLLEDSGYLTRVALLADRLMRGLGLDGRAVLPLVIGFGCNVPALTATKALPNARQRWLTALLVPYASCTARLVIFFFLARIFFPDNTGTAVFGLYVASVALIVLVGLFLRHTVARSFNREPLFLVLPPYQWPQVWPLLRSIGSRCQEFVWQAGRVIVMFSLVIWLLLCIPVHGGHSFGPATPAQDSLLGATAKGLAPAFAPAGLNDWHATAALLAGIGAKEVSVATLVTTFAMDPADHQASPHDTASQVRAAFDYSSGGHGAAAALAFMVFCLGYLPCIATMAEQRRLIGARPAWLSWGASLVLAWGLAVATFQIGRLW